MTARRSRTSSSAGATPARTTDDRRLPRSTARRRRRAGHDLCDGEVADDYVRVAPLDRRGYRDALDLARPSIDDQIVNTDDYAYRLEDEPLSVGCDFGGTITYTPTDTGTDLALTACEFTDGRAGHRDRGDRRRERWSHHEDARYPTDRWTTLATATGNRSVTGTYQGRSVDLSG